jgi:hypothetical protein
MNDQAENDHPTSDSLAQMEQALARFEASGAKSAPCDLDAELRKSLREQIEEVIAWLGV